MCPESLCLASSGYGSLLEIREAATAHEKDNVSHKSAQHV